MYRFIYTVFIVISINYNCLAQITFQIIDVPNDTPDTDTLYLASNVNNWKENDECYAFSKGVNGKYSLELPDVSFPFEYKITRGSWNSVETDIIGDRINNRKIESIDSIESIRVLGWYDHLYKETNTLSRNVQIMDSAFFMPQLKRNRKIWIYLPDSYATSNKKYPVIYMHDGQNLFNNSTSFAGEWNVDETMDKLIEEGNRESIIVGIDNGGRYRIEELTPFVNKEYGGGDGIKYLEFIVNILKPHIDNNFRTLKDRENTAIIGSSLGGLISFYGILKFKETFSKAGVMSPSFWFSDKIYFLPGYRNRYNLKIYFVAGDKESDTMVSNLEKMTERMKKMKYPDSSYKLKIIKDGQHNEKLWREEFADVYKWLMN